MMQISELRNEVNTALHRFAWGQWAQMGVSANSQRNDHWAADPEALLLLTFEVGRNEPRLFDEALDWLVTNERLVSVQRLRNLARDEEDRALVEASFGWVAERRPRARLSAKAARSSPVQSGTLQPFFRGTKTTVKVPDEAFLNQGWLKTRIQPSGKARAPTIDTAINFAFRIRSMLGVGARAEVVRTLLCSNVAHLSVHEIAESAAYAKRNVQEALTSLRAAKVIDTLAVANEQRYSAPRERWAQLFDLSVDELPIHRAWVQLFWALRSLVRWLEANSHRELSNYMLASEARVAIDKVAAELRFAGIPVYDSSSRGADYWPDFVKTVRAILNLLL